MMKLEHYLLDLTVDQIQNGNTFDCYYQYPTNNGRYSIQKLPSYIAPMFQIPLDSGPFEYNLYDIDVPFVTEREADYQFYFNEKDALKCQITTKWHARDIGEGSIVLDELHINFSFHDMGDMIYQSTRPLEDDFYYYYNTAALLTYVRDFIAIRSPIGYMWEILNHKRNPFDTILYMTSYRYSILESLFKAILNSEHRVLKDSVMDDFITYMEQLPSLTGILLPPNTPAFFHLLEECNQLELLKRIPLNIRLRLIAYFNSKNHHDVVALLNHYHKGDYRNPGKELVL